MLDNISKEQKKSFDRINTNLEQILKNAEYLTKKSKAENPYYSSYGHPESSEMCTGITYQLDKVKGIHPSNISIKCCTKHEIISDCLLEADIVIDESDGTSEDRIKNIFDHPICAITDTHSHDNEIHIHLLCNADSTLIAQKAKALNNIII